MNNKAEIKFPLRPKPAARGRKQTADMAKTAQRREHINVPYYLVLLLSLCGPSADGSTEVCSICRSSSNYFLHGTRRSCIFSCSRISRLPEGSGAVPPALLPLSCVGRPVAVVDAYACGVAPLPHHPHPGAFPRAHALIPFGFLAYFVGLNYSINYHRETSWLFSLPLAALIDSGRSIPHQAVAGAAFLGGQVRRQMVQQPRPRRPAGGVHDILRPQALRPHHDVQHHSAWSRARLGRNDR